MSEQPNLIEPFDIDDGELEGMTAALCFTLGVEWGRVTAALDAGDLGPFDIHEQNAPRLRAAVRRRGMIVSASPTRHGWTTLTVDRR